MRIRVQPLGATSGKPLFPSWPVPSRDAGSAELHCGPACPPERRAGNEKKTATATKTQRNAMGIRQQRIAIAKGLSDPTKAL